MPMDIQEAKSVVCSALNGTLNNDDVPRTEEFRKALKVLQEEAETPVDEHPAHHGDGWNAGEIQLLIEKYQNGETPSELANFFQRTERSVNYKLWENRLLDTEPE